MLYTSYIIAAEGNIKIGGGFSFISGFHDNNIKKIINISSQKNQNISLDTSVSFIIDASNIINQNTYGARFSIEATTQNNKAKASSLYMITEYGKIELGSDKSAMAKMKIIGNSVAVGSSGSWDRWPSLIRYPNNIVYIVSFGNFLDAKTRPKDISEYARKITYFTPEIDGIQIGISYIPDSSNNGYSSLNDGSCYELAKPLNRYKFAIINAFSYGINYTKLINEELKAKLSLVGENGKVKTIPINNAPNVKFKNLNSYTIGTQIDYKDYSVAVSYGNYLKSITSKEYDKIGRDTYLYSIGASYSYSKKLKTSMHHITTNHKKSIFNATTISLEYKITNGVASYIEGTYYSTLGKYLNNNNHIIKDKTKGKILLLGLKLEI